MALTRAMVEAVLVARLRTLLEGAEMAVTTAGDNVDLAEPLAWAMRQLSTAVADRLAPTDAELALIGNEDQLLDLAELATLETLATRLDAVDISVGGRSEHYSLAVAQVERAIERKRRTLARAYGWGGEPLRAGPLTLNFATKGDDSLPEGSF